MSGPRTLITGAEGFVGTWLVRHLIRRGARILGTVHPDGPGPPEREIEGIDWVVIDLRSRADVLGLIAEVQPAHVVHLAAIASPREAAANPIEALRVNYGVVDTLLVALAEHAPRTRFLNVGTGEAYGGRPEGSTRLTESEPLRPPSPYSATKAAAEARCMQAAEHEGLDVISVRPLNHSGPGRPPVYAEAAFARQIARIEMGLQEPVLRVGNLGGIRDFSDVRDVVEAYALLLERGESGQIYNVCSGQARTLQSVLDHLVSRSQLRPEIVVDPELYRENDPSQISLVGDPAKLEALGWERRYPFERTLDDLLEDWRARA